MYIARILGRWNIRNHSINLYFALETWERWYHNFFTVSKSAYTLDITGSEVVRAPVISWLNRNWAIHSNLHILRVVYMFSWNFNWKTCPLRQVHTFVICFFSLVTILLQLVFNHLDLIILFFPTNRIKTATCASRRVDEDCGLLDWKNKRIIFRKSWYPWLESKELNLIQNHFALLRCFWCFGKDPRYSLKSWFRSADTEFDHFRYNRSF